MSKSMSKSMSNGDDGRMPEVRLERLLRSSVAVVWLATGALVVHPYYRAEGTAWLSRLGFGPSLMFATCFAEIGLASVVLACPTSTPVALAQTAPVVVFTAILAVLDPMLLVHPFGMLSKNLPLLAVVWTAWLVAKEGWTARAERLLRVGMATVWITEGLFPKLLFQQGLEIEVLTRWGVSVSLTRAAIAATGVLQLLSGVLALVLEGRARAWVLSAQLAALIVLPLLVTISHPEMWFHPFGPFTKNAPILAGTFVLLARWPRTSS